MRKCSLWFSALVSIVIACVSGPSAIGQLGSCPVTPELPTGTPVATLLFDARFNGCFASSGDQSYPCCPAAASIDLPAGTYLVTMDGEVWSTEGYGGPAALPIAWGSGSCPGHTSANSCILRDPRAGGGPFLIDHPGGPVYCWRNDNFWGDNYGQVTINFYAAGIADLVADDFSYRVIEDQTGFDNGPIPVNANLEITAHVENRGGVDAGASKVLFFVSSDATIDPLEDVPLGSYDMPALPVGDTPHLIQVTVPMPIRYVAGSGYIASDARFTVENYHHRVWIGMVVDSDNDIPEGTEGEDNNANQGYGVDSNNNFLYDPILRGPLGYRDIHLADGRVAEFQTESAAQTFLLVQGFSMASQDLSVDTWWSKPLPRSRTIRSWFNNQDMPAEAFRIQPGGIRKVQGKFRITIQGGYMWVGAGRASVMVPTFGEPSPRWAQNPGFGAEWFAYVLDYHGVPNRF